MPLCNVCSKLDTSRYRNRKRLKDIDFTRDKQGLEYWLEDFENEFGTGDLGEPTDLADHRCLQQASDILARKEACDLCYLIAHRLEKNHVDLEMQIEIATLPFCQLVDNHGKVLETVRLVVSEIPKPVEASFGPVEAHDQDAYSKSQPRCILELQECSSPVPTTDDDPLSNKAATKLSGRVVKPKANVDLLKSWARRCDTLHGASCGESLFPVQAGQVLKSLLVIDVERMCITEAPSGCRYITLSYCWGTALMLKHTIANSKELRQDGALTDSKVPATISDAIVLVRGLGERFLWVDALCIVQDDPVSQKAQLAQMGLVYSRSAFTIVAASGDNADSGLPGIRPNTRNAEPKLVNLGDRTLLTVIDGSDYYNGLTKTIWSTRAWTLQEQILSKKLLIFTEQQTYWSCWKAVWLEEVVLEDVYNMSFHRNPVRSLTDDGYFSKVTGPVLYDYLVNYYRKRQLSYKSDILNAFSGLMQVFAATENESFHWGLPTSNFDQSLCWWLRGGGERNYSSWDQVNTSSETVSVPFPSWSWAGWHGSSPGSWMSWMAKSNRANAGPEPEVIFYGYDINGRLLQINQSSVASQQEQTLEESRLVQGDTAPASTSFTSKDEEFLNDWKGQYQAIHDIPSRLQMDTGLLHFWTSAAKLFVRRRYSPYDPTLGISKFHYSLVAFGFDEIVYMDAATHLPFKDVAVMSEIPEGNISSSDQEGIERYEVLAVDFVVISMNVSPGLIALAVEWKEGVAYRIGIMKIGLSRWAKLQNRAWKQVALG